MPDMAEAAGVPGDAVAPHAENGRLRMLLEDKDAQISVLTTRNAELAERVARLERLRGSLINDVAALNKVEVSGWYWCDRIEVAPLDQPHDELDASLDRLCRRAVAAGSVEAIQECFQLYPELQPPADAVAR